MPGDGTPTMETDPTEVGFGQSSTEPAAPDRHIGRYRIDSVIGSGGMGVVLAAYDPELDRQVAIKVLRHGNPELQARLVREAQAMARLHHANVVTVHDVGEAGDRVFVAMELVAGKTLRAWLAGHPPWRSIVNRFIDAARGLAAAHAAGIVHRDFKPDNVLVGDDGVVRVADFGLARAAADDAAFPVTESGELVTDAGQVLGTPAYMAPEQHEGGVAGPAADQYAFGAALWEALCAIRPFAGHTPADLAASKRADRLETPKRKPPRWALAILRRTLASAPEQRFPSMDEVIRALERGLHRRRNLAAAGVIAGAVAVTAAITFGATARGSRGPACQRARDSVAAVWDGASRAKLTAAFAASQRPHAPATLPRVLAALDQHATLLGDARVATCEATVRGERSAASLDRRMTCLDRRGDAMHALVGVLGRGGDDAVIDAAYESVLALPSADSCDVDAGNNAEPPPPAIAAEVAAARATATEAGALLVAGKLDEADAAIGPLRATAERLAYPPLLADVLALHARSLTLRGDAEAGVPAHQAAATAAAAIADDVRIADAFIQQIELLTDEGGKPQAALERLSMTEVAVARAASPPQREELLIARSDIYLALARFDEALADIVATRTAIENRLGADSHTVGRVVSRHADVLWQMGRGREAIELDQRVLAIWIETLGPDHPKVAQVHNNLGVHLEAVGRFDEARAAFERSLSIKERTFGPTSTSTAYALHNLGMVSDSQGRLDDAVAFSERALAIREAALGPDHPLVASTLTNLANAHRQNAQPEAALALQQRALAIRVAAHGDDHPAVASALATMANTLRDLGRLDEALAAATRSVAIREQALGPDHELLARSIDFLGNIEGARGNNRAACAAFARAAAILEKAHGPSFPDLTSPLTGLADCALLTGKLQDAIALAERAVRVGAGSGLDPRAPAGARFVLAKALWASGDRVRATAEARAARDAYATGTPLDRTLVADIDAWFKAVGAR